MTLTSRSAALVAGLFASAASAQSPAPVAPGWSAFAGCWQPIPVEGQAIPAGSPKVCVVPVGTNGADLLSVSDDKVAERTRIEADGLRHDVTRQGCSGWESASFSSDGRRLYMSSEQDCIGGLKRKTSGVFAMAADGQWLNIVNVSADGGEGLRVARYAPAAVTSAIPAEVITGLEARTLSDRTARIASQTRVPIDAVIESSKHLSAVVMEAWLAELGQGFDLDEKRLIQLADGGVAPSIIDVMVAVSNPKQFAVKATGSGVSTTETRPSLRLGAEERCLSPMLDPWGYYDYNPCDPFHRYGYYGSRRYSFGYNRYYGYGLYDPYGYGYGYGYNGYGYGRPVVIIVRGSDNDPEVGRGRMTKNGYTRGSTSSTGSTGTASSGSSSSGSSGSSSSGSSSSGSSSSGSSSSGSSGGSSSSSGRTATRKPPAN
jgi:hypothetical protein